ncbi:MAG: PA14 domain-containing protein [Planctomycetota bacterium]
MRGIAWLLASAWLALPDDGAPTTSGLLLRLERDLVADVRVARLLALHVPAGAPPSARLAPGPFVATWDGFLEIEARDRFTFAFEGDGSFELDLDEQPVLRVADARPESRTSKPVRLNKGKNRLKARYASATGAATVRVLWSSSEFPREPLSPLHLSHAGDAGDAARAARGRELFATRRCVKCHARGSDPARAMPELAPEFTLDAPLLNDAGARLERSWVAAWCATRTRCARMRACPRSGSMPPRQTTWPRSSRPSASRAMPAARAVRPR